jgi:pyruvate formate lyase activating enzyme
MDVPPTPPATLTRARRIAVAAGLRYVYTGNVHDLDGGQTRCPSCGEAVIRRDGYRLLHYDVRDGACGRCATPIAGVFENRPGNWGSRRLPVHVGGG